MLAGAALAGGCHGSRIVSSGSTLDALLQFDTLDPRPVVTISATSITPDVSHLARSVPVTFVNADSVAHVISDAPALGYGACPEARAVGTLQPGERHSVAVDRAGVGCAFEDTTHAGTRAFQGLLVVH